MSGAYYFGGCECCGDSETRSVVWSTRLFGFAPFDYDPLNLDPRFPGSLDVLFTTATWTEQERLEVQRIDPVTGARTTIESSGISHWGETPVTGTLETEWDHSSYTATLPGVAFGDGVSKCVLSDPFVLSVDHQIAVPLGWNLDSFPANETTFLTPELTLPYVWGYGLFLWQNRFQTGWVGKREWRYVNNVNPTKNPSAPPGTANIVYATGRSVEAVWTWQRSRLKRYPNSERQWAAANFNTAYGAGYIRCGTVVSPHTDTPPIRPGPSDVFLPAGESAVTALGLFGSPSQIQCVSAP